jgi:WhiB family redox-sensing transcriptional regulator
MIDLDRAACREIDDPHIFFPQIHDLASARAAKEICARCAVRLDCLALALRTRHLDGVWGGLTASERARYARTHH